MVTCIISWEWIIPSSLFIISEVLSRYPAHRLWKVTTKKLHYSIYGDVAPTWHLTSMGLFVCLHGSRMGVFVCMEANMIDDPQRITPLLSLSFPLLQQAYTAYKNNTACLLPIVQMVLAI